MNAEWAQAVPSFLRAYPEAAVRHLPDRLGRYVFRFHPAINLGATAGARTEPASLAVVQNALKSEMPALGFTVPYAVANIVLAVLAVVTVELLK